MPSLFDKRCFVRPLQVTLFACFAMDPSPLFAQTACPQGVPAGDPRCGPSPNWHQGQQLQDPQSGLRVIVRERYQVWDDRWGAIALGPQGEMGVSESRKSREEAMHFAKEACVIRGGDETACERMLITYKNDCVGFAWGAGHAQAATLPTIGAAEIEALNLCREKVGADCDVIYSGCSLPQERWTYERPKDFKPAD